MTEVLALQRLHLDAMTGERRSTFPHLAATLGAVQPHQRLVPELVKLAEHAARTGRRSTDRGAANCPSRWRRFPGFAAPDEPRTALCVTGFAATA